MLKKIWEQPKKLDDVYETMDRLSAVLQFVQDLTAQPTPPADEYDFSSPGYYGFYLFLGFVQDTIRDCMDVINENS
ncbi:MAG: hypothetical protein HUU08_17870 [Candidatus Brocadia sp.]|nr:hypothetical protein [Candidatus Brocadia sp.]